MMTECGFAQVFIKNTFIDTTLPQSAERRCASVPSSSRLNKGFSNGGEEAKETQPMSKASGASASLSFVSDASTDAGCASDEESVDSITTCTSGSSLPGGASPSAMFQGQQMVLVAIPVNMPVSAEQPVMQVTKLSTRAKAFTPEVTKLSTQAQAFTPEVTKLSTQAEAFTPGMCLQQRDPGTKLNANARKRCARFRWQCQQVVLAAKEVLAMCMFMQNVEVVTEKNHLSVNAQILPQYFQHKQQALTKAKQALLDNAESSQGVYVLGYRGKPFLSTPDGFFVILGVQTSMKDACWDTLCHGCCSSKGTCTLQHPVYQVPVYVNVTVASQ